MPLSTTHVTRSRVVAECVARTNVWARVQSCGLCPADFASGRVEFSNASSVVEAHRRAAVLLVWPPTVVQSGYDPTPVSTLLEHVHQPARRRLALTVSYRMVDLRQPPPPLVSRPEMSKYDLPAAISKLLSTMTKLRP